MIKSMLLTTACSLCLLTACTVTPSFESKAEARAHYTEQLRTNLITQQAYQQKLAALKASTLPEKSKTPIDLAEIREYYANQKTDNTQKLGAALLVLGAAAAMQGGGGYGGGGFAAGMNQGMATSSRMLNMNPPNTLPQTSYDYRTGNTYQTQTDMFGNTRVTGNNYATGSRWTSRTDASGRTSGYDSNNNYWTYDPVTKFYHNYGTGVSCYGTGFARRCY